MAHQRGRYNGDGKKKLQVDEMAHEKELARRFCEGCVSCNQTPSVEGFPICGNGIHTTSLVPPGTIILEDIKTPERCLKNSAGAERI